MKVISIPICLENGDGHRGDTLVDVSELCVGCRHFLNLNLGCDAFPVGIPDEILTGKFDHRKPYPGDHGIRYEKK